ncbi:Uma2 family endonuclease [Streptomyces sp. NPDC001717]|uniref:Uma2 family endonuclease n=1 Tax=Streptomyces sp. NPDC001717 TaxID=3364604 RepID=UPI0036A943A8
MSALAVEHQPPSGDDWDRLVGLWKETDWPEGCKVEIIEGIITVTPAPANRHNYIAAVVHRALHGVVPEEWHIYQTQAVAIPSKSGMYIPDLVVVPSALVLDAEDEHFIPAAAAELVAEITSKSSSRHDRMVKPGGYALAGVPLYLLVDAFAPGGPTITLYGEPKEGVYRVLESGKFGETFHIPAPFDFHLDTSDFPVP